jgi:hypothetical protein
MHSNHLAATLGLAILCLTPVGRANSSSFPKNNDIHCPEGSYTSFVHNSYTYNAPSHEFTNITKSFFDFAWYTVRAHPHSNTPSNT